MAEVRTRKRGRTWSYIFEVGKQNGKRKVTQDLYAHNTKTG